MFRRDSVSRARSDGDDGRRSLARWWLLGFCLTVVVALLFVDGLSTRTTGASRTPLTPGARSPLQGSRPILTFKGGRLVSREPPPRRRIALTFDDGPDPYWTPRIAAELRRLRVPATFFLVGSHVVRHPNIVRALYRQGFELGNHTFTHVELSSVPGWERSAQISLTESAIAGAVGIRPRLIRPPYSSVPAAVTRRQAAVLAGFAKNGYLIVLTELDTEDWRRPGVGSLAGSDYPVFEIIVVDDGSEDETAELVERLDLERVGIVRQANAGKSAALNTGIAAAAHSLVVAVDADTVFEPETLRRLVQPFRDSEVGAVSGNAKVGNRRRLLGRWQHIEYVIGFNLDRRLYDVLQCMPTVPGAVGAFRRQALDAIGGISDATLAEDTDITIALGRAGWRVVYAETARAWTEAPSSLSALWRQRYRWCYGTLQAVWKHRAALWSADERKMGRRGLPYLLLFQITLPLLAPLIDVFSIYAFFFLGARWVAAYWAIFTALQLALGWYAFRLDGESKRTLWAMPF